MSEDKLYGAASVYLILGLLWLYFYLFADYFFPGSFTIGGSVAKLSASDLIYFTFTVRTTTGFGDVTPVLPHARALVTLEQLSGTLFIAILIARLAGIHPAKADE